MRHRLIASVAAARRWALPLVVMLLAGTQAASASNFTYGSYSVTNAQDVTITQPNSVSGEAGQIVLAGSGGNTGQDILAWCLDVFTFLQSSGTYNVGPLTTAGSGGSNPPLSTTQIGEIGALMAYGNAHIALSTDVSAAIQLAIWMVEYSNFSYTVPASGSSVATLAQQYFDDATNGSWALDNNVSLLSVSDSSNQNLGFVDATPLPPALTMMVIGLAGFVFLAYPKRRLASLAS
jgi:hypothetical protein